MDSTSTRPGIISEPATQKPAHILVCITPYPANKAVIEQAAAAAEAFHAEFSAIYVERKHLGRLTKEAQRRLRENSRYASSRGASIQTMQGEDEAFLVAEFAKLCGATQIFLGGTTSKNAKGAVSRSTLPFRLMNLVPGIDIHVVPGSASENLRTHTLRPAFGVDRHQFLRDLVVISLLLGIATLLGFFFDLSHFNDSYIIPLYLLSILMTSVTTKTWFAPLISALLSIVLFNFFFAKPSFQFSAGDQRMPITFLLMLACALIVSIVTSRLQRHSQQSAQAAYQQKILFDTNRVLQRVTSEEDIISSSCSEMTRLTGRDVIFYYYEQNEDTLTGRVYYPSSSVCLLNRKPDVTERRAALECCRQKVITGSTTNTELDAKYLYAPVKTSSQVYGCIGVLTDGEILESLQSRIVQAVAAEAALAIENTRRARKVEEANLIAQNEQLRMRLLRAISHDLRTPLTAIRGNSSNLLAEGNHFDQATLHNMYQDINDNAVWLVDLVENLLSASRLEDGLIRINPQPEVLEDTVADAVNHLSTIRRNQTLEVIHEEDLILVMIDSRFIAQVISNILRNAVQYAHEDSHIVLRTGIRDSMAFVSIADDGDGVSEEIRQNIFEMFYTGEAEIVDSRRSMGLGLFLCRSIVKSHGGEITCDINEKGGCTFTFTLPLADLSNLRTE